MFTVDQLQLRRVAIDEPGQAIRPQGKKKLWTWLCPGVHEYPVEVSAWQDEPAHLLTEAAICADPYCYTCRKKHA